MILKNSRIKALMFLAGMAAFILTLPFFASADNGDRGKARKPIAGVQVVVAGDSGNVLVRGAKVTAISGNTLTATTALGAATLSWNVNVGADTEIIAHKNGKATLADVKVGDTINFSGAFAAGSSLSVNAKVIRGVSLVVVPPLKNTIVGTVKSIDSAESTFVLTTKNNGDVTVAVNASTTLMKNGVSILFSALSTGDVAKVRGSFNADTKVFTATSLSINVADEDDKKAKKEDEHKGLRGFFKMFPDKFHLNFNFLR